MAVKHGITEAFSQLCEQFTPTRTRVYISHPYQTRAQIKCHMSKILYTSLFTFLQNQDRAIGSQTSDIQQEVRTEFSWHILILRKKRKFDDANQLETLLNSLPLPDNADSDNLCAVLQFLLKLKDTGSQAARPDVGYSEIKLPKCPKRGEEPLLPLGPLCYGDTQLIQSNRFHYMHYPRYLFECQPMDSVSSLSNLFEMLPGCGLMGSGFFNVEGSLNDMHEQTTTQSLFGGLVQGRTNSINVRLELPELPEDLDSSLLEIRIPKSFSSQSMDFVDEGFKSQEESNTGSVHSEEDTDISYDSAYCADYDTSIYEKCLTEKISGYYTWETIGLGPGARMKPFLTEAGLNAFDKWNKAFLKSLTTAFPSIGVISQQMIPESELVKEVLNILIAVPSISFFLDLTDQCFTMREGLYISGRSSETLHSLVDDFLQCAMYYYRLNLFAEPISMNSFYQDGHTYKAFTGVVQSVLHYYRAVILSIETCETLLQLRIMCHKLLQEIRFLAVLCHCDNPVTDETKNNFPKGVKLLSYIYQHTLEASFSDHYPLMLSVLKSTAAPYLLFVQDWVYHGIYRDTYGEFMIEVNLNYLHCKDKYYWTNGFRLKTENIQESVPLFLKDLANEIFICGKSINLLKACNIHHFLCDVDDAIIPRVALTFSQSALRTLESQRIVYARQMENTLRENTISRQQLKERAEHAKHDLLVLSKQVLAKEIKEQEDKIKDKRNAVAQRKRKELDFLKKQMEDDIMRRAQQKKEALQSDKDFIDKLIVRELGLNENELELERQAREELMAHYGKLSKEAERKEQRALWRVRRAKLDLQRTEFLLDQERLLIADMDQHSTGQQTDIPDSRSFVVRPASPSLPAWAQRGLQGSTIEVMDNDDEYVGRETSQPANEHIQLPKGAQQGLQQYEIVRKSSSIKESAKSPSPRLGRKRPSNPDLNRSMNVNDETEETVCKSSIQTFSHMQATTESESPAEARPHIKMCEHHNASKETVSVDKEIFHVKTVTDKHITQESIEESQKPHLRTFDDMHANKLSDKPEHDNVPKLKHSLMQASTESTAQVWEIKKRNVFGHVSELSNIPEVMIPKMKKSETMSAIKESGWSSDYLIKPRIRINKSQTANTLSAEEQSNKRSIKMSGKMSATKESEYVDYEQRRVQMFKERNVHGHTADSNIEKLLYGQSDHNQSEKGPDLRLIPPISEIKWISMPLAPYQDNFNHLNDPPQINLLSSIPGLQYGSYSDQVCDQDDIQGYQYLPLETVIQSSVYSALETQVSLVNDGLVNYFISELKIEDHFMALRRYLCMGDGDFSEILCDLLMEKLGTNPRPQDLVNPMFLNNCLNKAVRLSVNADDKYADNVSFVHKYLPQTLEQTSPDVLDCIQLEYEVKWPLNIVITANSLHKYSQVFAFMLQLKRVVWIIRDVWQRLKRDAILHKLDCLYEFRELHLYRQEMQLFVKIMQEYISHQIVEMTWQEFQNGLGSQLKNLDDLHAVHNRYLDNALFRCLLTKNAASLMKIIKDIFTLILKFHRQLVMGNWNVKAGNIKTHSNYAQMKHTYKVFHEHSLFLLKVVSKLADRGYEPHLHELLLRLNFNHYYDK